MATQNRAAKYVGYVRYTVDKQIKDMVNESALTMDTALAGLLKLVEDGDKLSISYDQESDTYTVALYGSSRLSAHPGVGLSARHSVLLTALKLLHVVHYDVFAGEWPENVENNVDQYNW
jgi:hypothetical protein